jgi:hypothetical protein
MAVMHYRLGERDPQPGSNCYHVSALNDPEIGPALAATLEDMLGARLTLPSTPNVPQDVVQRLYEFSSSDRLPDIFDARLDDGDRHLCLAAKRAFDRLGEVRLLAVAHESGSGGFLTVAAALPEFDAEVRRNDRVLGGVALLRDDEGAPRVSPRLFRLVCANGSIVCTHADEGRVADAEPLEEAIVAAADPSIFRAAIAQLRDACSQRADLELHADEFYRLWKMVLPALRRRFEEDDLWARVVEHFRASDDDTSYGLHNAITATARDLPDDRARWALEAFAWRVVTSRPRVPRRGGAAAVLV